MLHGNPQPSRAEWRCIAMTQAAKIKFRSRAVGCRNQSLANAHAGLAVIQENHWLNTTLYLRILPRHALRSD